MNDAQINKAILKFSLTFTVILIALCACFSSALSIAAYHELDNSSNLDLLHDLQDEQVTFDWQSHVEAHDEIVRHNLFTSLIITNGIIIVLGAITSYYLARWTIKPIQKASKQKSDFITNASHELRTPLTAIAMENEIALRDPSLKKTDLTAVIKSNLEEINKLKDLTDHLLRLDLQEPVHFSQVNLKHVVSLAVNRLNIIAQEKKIHIENKVKATNITSNTGALRNLLIILLENAIKYSPENSTISITYENNTISISDQGPGIDKEDLPHIFNRFYRAEKSRSSHGYGLGLSLAKRLSAILDFDISAKNNPTKGATFSLRSITKRN